MAIITLREINKHYMLGQDKVSALNNINLIIEPNEYVAFTGSSGSGKSTLMNILGCLDRPDSGNYKLDGKDTSGLNENELAEIRNHKIGFIFQSFNLIPRITALSNVMQPLIYRNIPFNKRKEMAADALSRVGLADRMGHMPNQLSGGQRQRVAIARALITEPAILLADEPTGNLDSTTTGEIMRIFDILHSEGSTIIIVTHEDHVAAHCTRILKLHDGEIILDQTQTRSGQ